MWKVPVLLLVLGSAWLWVLAEGASTVGPEDAIVTTGVEDGVVTHSVKDTTVTPGANEDHVSTGLPPLVPRSTKSPGGQIEDLPTAGNTVYYPKESRSTRTPDVVTSHTVGKAGGNTKTTVEKDGLSTVTLVGIIVGVLLAIGFIGGIIMVVTRKMSGRFS
ncbi:PREDICTED: podoplanin [Ceratotherium simum simum]|uniref:Podoplanin n=1 Tax=Ceratotherium simum simum TaxID=73337 RepID=A0ABM1CII3_CERSS|nr:PREDICTED: podoplanin [Ceratotherium simum simum]